MKFTKIFFSPGLHSKNATQTTIIPMRMNASTKEPRRSAWGPKRGFLLASEHPKRKKKSELI